MNAKSNLGIKSLRDRSTGLGLKLRPYRLPVFLLLVALLYGFLLLRINSLSSAQPSPDAVSSQFKAAKLTHIDQTVIKQIKSLQDNSVNVRSLFDQARNNPFQQAN